MQFSEILTSNTQIFEMLAGEGNKIKMKSAFLSFSRILYI